MGCANNPCSAVGTQHRRTISGQDTQNHTRTITGHGVGFRGLLSLPRLTYPNGGGGMNLIGGNKIALPNAKMLKRNFTIARNVLRRIVGTETTIQTAHTAIGGNPAKAAKKAMANTLQRSKV
jgi:hypothetical protein